MIPKHYIKNNLKYDISLIDINKYIKAHLDFGNHRHTFYELLLVVKGNGIHQIDFTNYKIQGKSISFLAPGQVHNLQKSLIKDCVVLIFNEDFIYKTNENSTLLKQLNFVFNQVPILDLTPHQLNELKNTISIVNNELEKENQSNDILYYTLNLLLFQILNFCKEQSNLKLQPTGISKQKYFEFLELVENNYSKQHSVQFYAKQLNLHPKRLNEYTQIANGENALYLIKKRILIEAKRLLFYSNLSVKEIAYQIGFEDVSYFSKFFLKNEGIRPTTFQKSNPESTI